MNRGTPLTTWPPLASSVARCTGAVGAEVAVPLLPAPSAAVTTTESVVAEVVLDRGVGLAHGLGDRLAVAQPLEAVRRRGRRPLARVGGQGGPELGRPETVGGTTVARVPARAGVATAP